MTTTEEGEVMRIGVDLTPEEVEILSLPPKTSINPVLRVMDFKTNIEVSHTKARYSLRDELGDFREEKDNLSVTIENKLDLERCQMSAIKLINKHYTNYKDSLRSLGLEDL